jgi:Uma2 family endonuclease
MVAEQQLLTAHEFASMPKQQARAELIGGEIVVSPSPTPRHDIVISNLKDILRAHCEDRGLSRWYQAPIDLYIGAYDVLQPDLMVFSADQEPGLDDLPVRQIPVIVIEVLSPGTRRKDVREKLPRYAGRGIDEFWIIDPANGSITINLLRDDGTYQPYIVGNEPVRVGRYRGVTFPLDRIFPQ